MTTLRKQCTLLPSVLSKFSLALLSTCICAVGSDISHTKNHHLQYSERHELQRSLSTVGDLLGEAPLNYTLLNKTCPFDERRALQAALLMAYVGYGSEYWYMGLYTAFAYKVSFFVFTIVSTFLLRLYPIPPGGDNMCMFLLSLVLSVSSFVCWTWQVYNFLDMYHGRFLDACGRIPEPIFSFVTIYYWELHNNNTDPSL